MYTDACGKDFMASPSCDLFLAGFPCQPFSAGGKGRGMKDKSGQVMISLVKWLHVHKPKAFLLENVPGLLQRHPSTMLLLISLLQALKDARGRRLYNVSWQVLHCGAHGYIPQNRSRLFIVGLRNADCELMVWPSQAWGNLPN
eukprot:Skav203674  [mRNA]  locus=scaffold259:11597:12025:+ [translate_table: standard]